MTQTQWMRKFGRYLQDRLDYANMSRKEFSKYTGISESSLSRYINAEQAPTVFNFLTIIAELELFDNEDVNELFDEIINHHIESI